MTWILKLGPSLIYLINKNISNYNNFRSALSVYQFPKLVQQFAAFWTLSERNTSFPQKYFCRCSEILERRKLFFDWIYKNSSIFSKTDLNSKFKLHKLWRFYYSATYMFDSDFKRAYLSALRFVILLNQTFKQFQLILSSI